VRAARAILLLCLAAAGVAAPGCGKKGPPLEPLSRMPGRPSNISASRTGDVVSITFTIPSANNDETKPADLARVDLYAYTALSAWDVFDLKRMTRVASIPVRKPPEPVNEKDEKKKAQQQKKAEQQKKAPPREPEQGVEQGAVVTVTETLTPEMQTPIGPDKKPAARVEAAPPSWLDTPRAQPLTGPVQQAEPRRWYVAFGVSHGGIRGGASPRPGISFSAPPVAPPQPQLKVTEGGVVVSWDAPEGSRLPYQEPAEGDILPAASKGMPTAPALSYVVYRVPNPKAAADKEAAAGPAAKGPVRATAKPLTALSWTDPEIELGVERCYEVRTVQVQDSASIESPPSPVACVTPTDVFPPPAPTSLAAVAGEGAISLIWKSVDAPDLGGYIVLRGEAPAGELKPLFDAPIRESTYRDTAAKPGVRYIYAVVALDTAMPPNQSPPSNRVEETAR
jgi:hypothetical protein